MDLNFLVFPKPEFKCCNDLFYTRLLFIPKRDRGIRELTIKSRGFSFKKPKDLSPDEDFIFPKDPLQDDMEGKPLPLRIMVKKNFLFGKIKPTTLAIDKPKREPISAGFTDSNNTFEKPEGDEGPHIPADAKVVRFPSKAQPKLIAQSLNLKRDTNTEVSVPGGGIEIKKNLKFQSSRQSIRIERNKEQEKPKVTISKLMSDLDGFRKKKSSGLSHMTKTNLDKKFELLSKSSASKKVNKEEVDQEADIPTDELLAPQERTSPQKEDHKTDTNEQLKCFLQRRSLNELKNRFGVTAAKLKESDSPKLTAAQPKLNIFFKHMPSTKKPSFVHSTPLKSNQESTEELPINGSPQEKLSKYQRPQLHLKKCDMDKRLSASPLVLDKVNTALQKSKAVEATTLTSLQNSIKRNKQLLDAEINEHETIPCLLLKPELNSDFVVLYFHANGEDIQQIQFICDMLKASLNVPLAHLVLGRRHGVPGLQHIQVRPHLRTDDPRRCRSRPPVPQRKVRRASRPSVPHGPLAGLWSCLLSGSQVPSGRLGAHLGLHFDPRRGFGALRLHRQVAAEEQIQQPRKHPKSEVSDAYHPRD